MTSASSIAAPGLAHALASAGTATTRPPGEELSWEEIGLLSQGFSFASRPFKAAIKEVTAQYSLGPRGAWMLLLISNGDHYPLDLANMFHIGRSLITAELAQLTEAGLITSRRSAADGRRMELALTHSGAKACVRIREAITRLVNERLSAYSREELLLCSKILRDFQRGGDEPGQAG